MLKQTRLLPALLALLFFAGTSLSAQDRVESLREIDEVTGVVAGRLDQRLRSLGEGGQLKIALGRFTTEGEDTPLGDLFRSNMMSALANVERRPYLIIDAAPGAQGQADYLFSGELLDVTSAVRIVVKLVRVSDSSLAGTWTADIEKTPWIAGLIERAGSSGARRDQYETDSEESPIPAEIGGPWLSRTIHNSEDRDYFLIVSPQRAMLTAETSGSMDTMMELYSEGSRIQSDDDGGEGENSRITFTA
ncbi:MAG: hypothetical protein LBQ35_08950, partial [Spirochaetaceae bacterium]|nr:hypothetical protein [Spirochaetaceae bacterium]